MLQDTSGEGRLPFIHLKNLGNDVPGAVELDESVEVGVVGADRVFLHVHTHHRRRRRNREHVDPRLDVRRGAVLFDTVVEVLDRAPEQLAIGEASLWKASATPSTLPTRNPSTYLETVETISS